MNGHSLCPANEYAAIDVMAFSIVFRAVSCKEFEVRVDQIQCMVNGSAMVQRIGIV